MAFMKKECCSNEENLGPEERLPDAGPDEVYRRCKVCKCRHFTVSIDPMVIGIKGNG